MTIRQFTPSESSFNAFSYKLPGFQENTWNRDPGGKASSIGICLEMRSLLLLVSLVCCSCTSVVVEALEPVYVRPGAPATATFRLATGGVTALISEYPPPNPRERCFLREFPTTPPAIPTTSLAIFEDVERMLQCVAVADELPQYIAMSLFDGSLPSTALVFLPNADKYDVRANAGPDCPWPCHSPR